MIKWFNPSTGNQVRGGQAIGAAGLSDLMRELNMFPEKLSRKVLFGALRDSAQPMVRAAKNAAPVRSGILRRSIRASSVKQGRIGPVLLVLVGGKRNRTLVRSQGGVKRKEKITEDAYYAPWVEFGTKEHEITTAFGPKSLAIGNRLFKKVQHPGARATNFFSTAIASSTQDALNTFTTRVRERLAAAREAKSL